MSHDAGSTANLPPITTLLTPAERPRVDAAGEGCYRTLHRDTVDDIIHDLKSRHVHAVLVSVSCAGAASQRGSRRWCGSFRAFRRSRCSATSSARTPHAVLALGQSWDPAAGRRTATGRLARAAWRAHGRHR